MELFDILKDKLFWIATAIGSVSLAVLANLITPKIADLLGRYSGKIRTRRYQNKVALWGQILNLYQDTSAKSNLKLDSIYTLLKSIACIVISLLIFSVSPHMQYFFHANDNMLILFFVMALLVAVYGGQLFLISAKSMRITRLADKRSEALSEFLAENPSPNRQFVFEYVMPDPHIDNYLNKWDEENIGISSKELQLGNHDNVIETETANQANSADAKNRAAD